MASAEIMRQFVVQFPSFRAVWDYCFNIIERINVFLSGLTRNHGRLISRTSSKLQKTIWKRGGGG
jgi:hypothetical protein